MDKEKKRETERLLREHLVSYEPHLGEKGSGLPHVRYNFSSRLPRKESYGIAQFLRGAFEAADIPARSRVSNFYRNTSIVVTFPHNAKEKAFPVIDAIGKLCFRLPPPSEMAKPPEFRPVPGSQTVFKLLVVKSFG